MIFLVSNGESCSIALAGVGTIVPTEGDRNGEYKGIIVYLLHLYSLFVYLFWQLDVSKHHFKYSCSHNVPEQGFQAVRFIEDVFHVMHFRAQFYAGDVTLSHISWA